MKVEAALLCVLYCAVQCYATVSNVPCFNFSTGRGNFDQQQCKCDSVAASTIRLSGFLKQICDKVLPQVNQWICSNTEPLEREACSHLVPRKSVANPSMLERFRAACCHCGCDILSAIFYCFAALPEEVTDKVIHDKLLKGYFKRLSTLKTNYTVEPTRRQGSKTTQTCTGQKTFSYLHYCYGRGRTARQCDEIEKGFLRKHLI